MSDFSAGWRPSVNFGFAPRSDPLQRRWMLDAVTEPDEARAARGVPLLDDRSNDYLGGRLWRETPFVDPNNDWFGMARPQPPMPGPSVLPETQGLPPPRPLSFRQQNDDAVFGQQIGGLLSGAAPSASPFDALGVSATGGQPRGLLDKIARRYR